MALLPGRLTTEAVEQFREDGYIVLLGFVEPEVVEGWRCAASHCPDPSSPALTRAPPPPRPSSSPAQGPVLVVARGHRGAPGRPVHLGAHLYS